MKKYWRARHRATLRITTHEYECRTNEQRVHRYRTRPRVSDERVPHESRTPDRERHFRTVLLRPANRVRELLLSSSSSSWCSSRIVFSPVTHFTTRANNRRRSVNCTRAPQRSPAVRRGRDRNSSDVNTSATAEKPIDGRNDERRFRNTRKTARRVGVMYTRRPRR